MPSALLVPMHVDCLWLRTQTVVENAHADFTRLPWFNGQRDINPDTPPLAESIANPPFEGRPLTLEPGLHLHWSLPAALSCQRGSWAGAEAGQWARSPNRWLVSRFRNGVLERDWVVESDYLHPLGTGEYAVLYPYNNGEQQPPYRALGRRQLLSDWAGNATPIPSLDRLTAVGYGEPAFAAWYPACHSVFGFYDAEASQAERLELHYDVLGWYHNPAQDPLTDIDNPQALKERLQWTLPKGTAAKRKPADRSVCFGRSRMVAPTTKAAKNETRIAWARTGSEALSALLAEQLSQNPQEQALLEDLIESVELAPALEHRQLDVGKKFREARHKKGFIAAPGGQRWTLRPARDMHSDDSQRPGPQLPAELARLLETANHTQQQHEEAQQTIDALRSQLYADWCKYQHCNYPPEDARENYPDADELKAFIERVDLKALHQWQAQTGEVQLASSEQGDLLGVRSDADQTSSAARLAVALNQLLQTTDLFTKTGFCGSLHGPRSIVPCSTTVPILAGKSMPSHALHFNGKSNYLIPSHCIDSAAPTYSSDSSLPKISCSAWVRTLEPGTIACWGANAYWSLAISPSRQLVFRSSADDGSQDELFSNAIVADGEWHHVALRYSEQDSSKSIFVDGQLDIKISAHEHSPLGNGAVRGGCIGARIANTEKTNTALELEDYFHGELSQFRLIEAALSDQALLEFSQTPAVTGVALQAIPAARFWQPREPVVLINGAITEQRATRRPTGELACFLCDDPALASFDTASGHEFGAIAAALRASIDANAPGNGAQTPGFSNNDGEQFEATLLEWQAEVWPLHSGFHENNNNGQYSANYIRASHQLSPDHADLAPRLGQARVDPAAAVITGRCVLSNHANLGLQRQLTQLLDSPKNRKKYPQLVQALAHLKTSEGQTLSQALSGFNAALLQRHQVLQLPIKDPLAFADQKPFGDAVATAVGKAGGLGALPSNAFMPITAGACRLLRLRLLDRFGRSQELDLQKIISPQLDQIPGSDHLLRMSPRITQPARIEMRWLAADDGLDEMNAHLDSSPICGWLVPNHLDDRVTLYDSDQQPLGRLGSDARGIWHPAVGTNRAIPSAELSNRYLRQLLEWLLRQPSSFYHNSPAGFRQRLDQAQEKIHPANASQHKGLALLMGQPIAVVRLSLKLRLQGPAAANQDWNVLRRNLKHLQHDHSGFNHVELPMQLGESEQFNDGLLGYWIEREGKPTGKFLSAQEAPPVLLTPNGPAITVTALIDPRCALHVRSGVLPVKSIDLPPEHYARALSTIGASFLTAPIISDSNKFNLPLQDQAGYQWSWLSRDDNGDSWSSVPRSALGAISRDARFTSPQEIKEGWLQLSPTHKDDTP